jgi:hypothetical protein
MDPLRLIFRKGNITVLHILALSSVKMLEV